ncbi:for [Symbiodinium natans]|uniref:cGMP-dependent protein kinase n=1 Tax=Symbiodinium natans TaxID=878477 RepID=A0A812QKU5_9DINO|nr:for [Symbiodinium natans]
MRPSQPAANRVAVTIQQVPQPGKLLQSSSVRSGQSPRSPPRAVVAATGQSPPRAALVAAGQSPRSLGQSQKPSSVAAPSPRSPGQIRQAVSGQSPRSPGQNHRPVVSGVGQSSQNAVAPRPIVPASLGPRPVVAARQGPSSFVQHGGTVQRASGSFAPPIRVASPQVTGVVPNLQPSQPVAKSPSKLSPAAARSEGPARVPGQRSMTTTSTLRTSSDMTQETSAKEVQSSAPSDRPSVVRNTQQLGTVSLRPQSTPQGSRRLQTRRKSRGAKSSDVCDFLRDSLRRDPMSVQAQLTDADLSEIVSLMDYYEFDPESSDDEDGVGSASGYIFVVDNGSFEVRIDGTPVATLGRGCTFGWNFLMKQPQSSSVYPCVKSGLWGADGQKIQQMLTERIRERLRENRKLLDCVSFFKGLPPRQIELLSSAIVEESVPAGRKVVAKGELSTALYFIRRGQLRVEENQKELGPGDYFGERALLHRAPRSATVVAETEAELLRLEAENLKSVVGPDLLVYLSRSLVLEALRSSQACGQFAVSQQSAILKNMKMMEVPAGSLIEAARNSDFLLLAVIQGSVSDHANPDQPIVLPGQAFEVMQHQRHNSLPAETMSGPLVMTRANSEITRERLDLVAGEEGAKVALLTESGLEAALGTGDDEAQAATSASSTTGGERFAQKMLAVKKVPIFRHLNKQQTQRVVRSLQSSHRSLGEVVIRQGESGNHFFVIVKGEVTVTIDGKKIRTQGKNASFGERALLFDEPRSATVQVSSDRVELWTLEKSVFKQIITAKMRKDLEYRISIQDAGVTLHDLKPMNFLGAGAFSTVRLVEHRKSGAKYALKTCKRTLSGKMPAEMQTECDILAENDHPFILYMVAVFETRTCVSMLTEILAGGELWSALRKLPVMLSRDMARFYTASILIAVEALWDRNVVYRDLKPENVMLDQEGYVKIIDFGVSKKLGDRESRTYTVVGTPHYMAPEVFQGKGYGVEVDLWSLGIMLFEFVCGYLPFASSLNEPRQVCSAILRGKLKFPSAYKDEVGRDLIKGLLTQPVLKRLGAGVNGLQDVFNHPYFEIPGDASIFDKLLGREVEPPYAPGPWRPPSDQRRPAGYSKEEHELFEHPSSRSTEVVKQNGFFCSVFRRMHK